MIVNYKKLTKTAKEPTRGSEYSAGFDLYADIEEDIVIRPHETIKVGTGLAFELPENTFGAIFARSGIATKQGLRPSNCVGVCDADYRGEYIVALHNDTSIPQIIKPQERIAQMVLLPYISMEFNEVEMLSETVRGNGGFGSSGTR
jgi:dUTP pyrophosphatase